MNRTAYLFLGLAISASALASFGCGNGGNTSGAGGTGGHHTTATTGTHSSTSGSTNASTGTMGTGGSPTAKLDCPSYCTEIMANCSGEHAQYSSMGSCLGTCAAFTPGTLADTKGDTLGCRIYHGGAPAKADPVMHCPHAGITGGDKDPLGTTGTCGEPCDAFCTVALVACKGQTGAYPTMDACMTECKTFKADTASYSSADTANNDMGCRMYHLSVAATDAMSAMTHCGHIHAVSPVCTM